MSYTQAQPKYEAEQFTGSNFAAFQAVVDPASNHNMTLNDDGTCSYSVGFAGSFVLNPGDWLITQAYFGMFPGWDVNGGATTLGDADFQVQYVAG